LPGGRRCGWRRRRAIRGCGRCHNKVLTSGTDPGSGSCVKCVERSPIDCHLRLRGVLTKTCSRRAWEDLEGEMNPFWRPGSSILRWRRLKNLAKALKVTVGDLVE